MNLSATSYHRMLVVSVLVVLVGALAIAQPKYRTFNQVDLAEKKQKKAGKQVSSDACFHFVNTTGITVNSLHARFNGRVLSIQDSGGFTSIDFDHKHKAIDATGRTVAPGDSVVFCGTFDKKDSAIHVNFWRWDTNGVPASPKYEDLEPWSVQGNRIQPNGGTVREYLYKKVITRPAGLVIGLPNPTTGGWIRYKTADRKYFPHTDSSRCFDFIKSGEGNQHPFIGELKNPHVKKHNNHLLGEVHALRLAIVANDSGVTSPFDASTRLGDLHYSGAGDDPCNGLTVRQITRLADSALTYCNFDSAFYFKLDSCVSKINHAFDGPYIAITFHPLTIAGTNELPPWLTPSNEPVIPHFQRYSAIDDLPIQYALQQNYPNPFNPTTTIEFNLAEPSIVTLTVYNLLGQEVATVLDREEMEDGEQSVELDASNLTSGVYFYRIVAQGTEGGGQFQAVKRMVLLK